MAKYKIVVYELEQRGLHLEGNMVTSAPVETVRLEIEQDAPDPWCAVRQAGEQITVEEA